MSIAPSAAPAQLPPKDASSLALAKGQAMSARARSRKTSASAQDDDLDAEQQQCGPRPCHRRCNLCPRYDDDADPIDSTPERKVIMWWGKPPGQNGETRGSFCGYCMKWYCARVRGIPGMTLTKYANELGMDEQLFKQHTASVECMIQKILANGRNRGCRIDYEALEDEVLEIVNREETVVKKPGYMMMPKAFYISRYGDLASNGMRAEGHYEQVQPDGSEVVVVPEDPITRVEFQSRKGVERRQRAGSTSEAGSAEALRARQEAIAEGLSENVGFRGAFLKGNIVAHAMGGGLEVGVADTCSSTTARAATRKAPNAMRAALGASPSAPPTPRSGCKVVASRSSGAGAGGRSHPAALVPPPVSAAADSGRGIAALVAVGGVSSASTPASSKKGARGRPKKDLKTDVDAHLQKFLTAPPTDPSWWGPEAKTQVKVLQNLSKDILARLKTSTDLNEIATLGASNKQLTSMTELVEEARVHGVSSNEFKQVYDLMLTRLQLEPIVTLELPPHLKYARHKIDIQATDSHERWLQWVTTEELKKQGLKDKDIASEQEKLWSERIASVLKLRDSKEALAAFKILFDIERTYDLEEPLSEFVMNFGVLLSYESFEDLEERVELLRDATGLVARSLPSQGSPGTCLGNVLASWPRGKRYLDDALAHLAKAEVTLSAMAPFHHKVKLFSDHSDQLEDHFRNRDRPALTLCMKSLKSLSNALASELKECLPAFLPQVSEAPLQEPLHQWLSNLYMFWRTVLKHALLPDLDMTILREWLENTVNERILAQDCTQATKVSQDMLLSNKFYSGVNWELPGRATRIRWCSE